MDEFCGVYGGRRMWVVIYHILPGGCLLSLQVLLIVVLLAGRCIFTIFVSTVDACGYFLDWLGNN